MPIANCYCNNLSVEANLDDIVHQWSKLSGIEAEYITLNFFKLELQAGKMYKIMVHLFLPTLWKKDEVKNIQLTLAIALANHFYVTLPDVFIMTSLISSENVVEDGAISLWPENYNN